MKMTRTMQRLFPVGLVFSLCVLSPLVASAQSTSDAIATVSPKIVKIFGAGGRKNLYAYGSGFLVSPQGHIATAWSHILDGDTVNVVLHDGRRYEGVPGGLEWREVAFREHGIPVQMPEVRSKGKVEKLQVRATSRLIGSDDPGERSELAWRTAVPVMALALTLLAVPLAKLRPRQGRFARVGWAVLAYFAYSNLVAAVRVWIEKDSAGGALGMWWVHLLPIGIAALLVWREERPGPLWRRGGAG